ncbi:MAG: AgmX/PglI C-terminal domain-containing protein [Myxococcales bacterium]|nr:AgmX/PglI C-terminal domain-containing protein [Myxococcales bacterium]MCB9708968.1 AgmX/PglI C-terminal domain-containing protein [Myxococcales bacterium]
MKTAASLLMALGLSACSAGFAMRSQDRYQQDTREVLATRDSQIQSCYNSALSRDQGLRGDVVVKFDVAEDTGTFTNATILEEETTAPQVLQECVLNALVDLQLSPPDEQKGIATYTWSFRTRS